MLNSPFMQAGATKAATRGLLKGSKFSFNGILTNLEKTVSTINQVVPLYNQVRPLISNSKTLINAFKSTSNRNKRQRPHQNTIKKEFNPDVIDANINTQYNPQKEESPSDPIIFTSINTPNKPFFI